MKANSAWNKLDPSTRWDAMNAGSPPPDVPYYALGVDENLESFSGEMRQQFKHPTIDYKIVAGTSDGESAVERAFAKGLQSRGYTVLDYLAQIRSTAASSPNAENILMDLDGIDVQQFKRFMHGESAKGVHTNSEIKELLSDQLLFEHTRWFQNGRELTFEELEGLFGNEFPNRFRLTN